MGDFVYLQAAVSDDVLWVRGSEMDGEVRMNDTLLIHGDFGKPTIQVEGNGIPIGFGSAVFVKTGNRWVNMAHVKYIDLHDYGFHVFMMDEESAVVQIDGKPQYSSAPGA